MQTNDNISYSHQYLWQSVLWRFSKIMHTRLYLDLQVKLHTYFVRTCLSIFTSTPVISVLSPLDQHYWRTFLGLQHGPPTWIWRQHISPTSVLSPRSHPDHWHGGQRAVLWPLPGHHAGASDTSATLQCGKDVEHALSQSTGYVLGLIQPHMLSILGDAECLVNKALWMVLFIIVILLIK